MAEPLDTEGVDGGEVAEAATPSGSCSASGRPPV